MTRTWSKLGIAGQFYLLGAVVFLPFMLVIALKTHADFRQRVSDDSTTAFRHARNVAEQAARFNRQSFEILRGLALRPAIRAMSSSPCDPVFDHFLSANKSYANLLLDNADGDVICNAAKGPNLKGLVANRPWFRNLMATATRQTGDPTVGRVVGRWIVALAEPVVDAAGRARGAVVLTVDLWNYQLHLDRDFAESSFLVTILDSRGAVVARSRNSSQWVGKKVQVPFEAILSIREGDSSFVRDADGAEQLYGHATVPGTDWVVLVSSPKSAVDSLVSDRLRFELPFAALLLFLLFSAAYLVARRIRQPVEAAARAAEAVGDGRFDVRLPESGDNRELGILGQKFNRMAERLRAAETRRTQAIADLAGSEAQTRLIADNVPVAISYLDAGLRLRFVNRTFCEMFGSGPQEVALGKHLREIIGEAAYALIESHYTRALAGHEVAYERTLTRPGADSRDIETRLIPRFSEANRVDGCYALTFDVTERKIAEAARGWLAAIVEHSNDAIIGRSLEGTILSWNKAAEHLFGYRANEAIGQPITLIMPPERQLDAQSNSAALQKGGEVPRAEAVRRTKDGRLITVLRSVSPIRNAAGEVIGAAITARDITERKRAEEARAWLAAIVEHSNDAIIGRSLDGEILSWNAAAERLYGYSADEAIGQPITLTLLPDQHADMERNSAKLKSGAEILLSEVLRRTKDGRLISVMSSISPIRNAAGEIIGAAAVVRDISESKRAEEALRRFRVALDNSADMILLVDRTTMRYVDVNETACRLLGYSREEITRMGPQDVLPASREELERSYDALIAEPSVMGSMRSEYRCKDGSLLPFESTRHVIFSGDGHLIAAVSRDIRERNRTEAQQRLAASVFDNALDGIMVTDAAFQIVAVNRAFTEITGYSAPEAIGNTPRLLRSYQHDEAFYHAMQEAIKGTGNWQGEVWDKRKNGELYCELLSISPVRDERGEVTNYCAIFADITKLKATESELMALNAQLEERVAQRTAALDQANRELETFSYSVSHDLRAPLRHINGFSAIVLKRNADSLDEDSVEYLKKINAASERMGELIADLLALARISRQELNRRDFDLSGLAREVADSLLEMHPRQNVRMTLTSGMKASGDPGLVRIVLENLLGNAWKFSACAAEAVVEIGSAEIDGQPAYYVRDNGAGFEMEYAHRLFAPFQRLHTEAEFEGTGIGLSIVQRIVSRHGGRVWAQAETGKGATFWFTLGKSGYPA